MNPLRALLDAYTDWRDTRLATTHGSKALIAWGTGDIAGFRRHMEAVHRDGGGRAVYLTVIGWLLTARNAIGAPAAVGDDFWSFGLEADGEPVDDPDAQEHPIARAGVWAGRMYVAVLNDDRALTSALFNAVTRGDPRHFGLCLQAAAELATAVVADETGAR